MCVSYFVTIIKIQKGFSLLMYSPFTIRNLGILKLFLLCGTVSLCILTYLIGANQDWFYSLFSVLSYTPTHSHKLTQTHRSHICTFFHKYIYKISLYQSCVCVRVQACTHTHTQTSTHKIDMFVPNQARSELQMKDNS